MNFKEYMSHQAHDKFDYFMETRTLTNRTATYWVNWDKVTKLTRSLEVALNTLNYLVGKKDIRSEAKKLFIQQPDLIKVIPTLLATREKDLALLDIDAQGKMLETQIDFSQANIKHLDSYLDFMEKTGLLRFLSEDLKQSLVDYVYGVQVGLDSNGRKNRSGTQNEEILSLYLDKIKQRHPELETATQVTNQVIESRWQIHIPPKQGAAKVGGRRYDGAIYSHKTGNVTIIETNFYGGGGSKLKAVAGEFSDLYAEDLKPLPNVGFVWISDGCGWDTAKNPLSEAFEIIPNIFNLKMLRGGFLEDLVCASMTSELS